tara:strand:+ start:7554 stop:8666 length:1113 start_codon:yes stop_codon:yes gene_type:complete
MLPEIKITSEDSDILKFEINNTSVSIVNGLRRILLANIPTVVFKTTPYTSNKCDILINTTRLNNEILKQRLSCIPIHITDLSLPLEQYLVKVDKKNDSNNIEFVTTEDFKIINTVTNKEISESEKEKIFPKNSMTQQYIDFCRLRPKLSNNMDGEHLKFSAVMELGTAAENGMYNAVSKASFGNTIDSERAALAWAEKEKELQSTGNTPEIIEYERKNWYLLEAQRYYKSNSFDFVIETVGVFKNRALVKKACDVIILKLLDVLRLLEEGDLRIINSNCTIVNCFDIILENEDFTLGKVIEYILYILHYEGDTTLSFLGFRKAHPHDTQSYLRMAFHDKVSGDLRLVVQEYIKNAISKSIDIYKAISGNF